MRKGDYCIRNIEKLVEEGCINQRRADELENWQKFRDKYPDMSELSERACTPLMRETDPEIKAKAIEAVAKNISNGNVPTAKQVSTLLDNKRVGIKPKGHISKDLSGVYRPPVQTPIPETKSEEDVVAEENVVISEDIVIDEDVVDEVVIEEDEVVTVEETFVGPSADEDDFESIPQMPEMVPHDLTLVVDEEKEEKEEEKPKKSQMEVDAEAQARLERMKELEEQRADKEAEKIVVTCLKSILKRGYPGHKLSWLVDRAVSDVLIPDRGCPMPNSGSATRGGAITSNLGAR